MDTLKQRLQPAAGAPPGAGSRSGSAAEVHRPFGPHPAARGVHWSTASRNRSAVQGVWDQRNLALPAAMWNWDCAISRFAACERLRKVCARWGGGRSSTDHGTIRATAEQCRPSGFYSSSRSATSLRVKVLLFWMGAVPWTTICPSGVKSCASAGPETGGVPAPPPGYFYFAQHFVLRRRVAKQSACGTPAGAVTPDLLHKGMHPDYKVIIIGWPRR